MGGGELYSAKSRIRLELSFPLLSVVVFHFLPSLLKLLLIIFRQGSQKLQVIWK